MLRNMGQAVLLDFPSLKFRKDEKRMISNSGDLAFSRQIL